VETLPGPAGDSWGEDGNARRYDAYAREYPNGLWSPGERGRILITGSHVCLIRATPARRW